VFVIVFLKAERVPVSLPDVLRNRSSEVSQKL
jgi:hypothetical protein